MNHRRFLLLAVWMMSAAGVATAQGTVISFDLGATTITHPAAPDTPIETALQGVLALPDAAEAAPLVLILHGRHGICGGQTMEPFPCPPDEPEERFDEGYAYLAQALATRGYAVLVPNLNAAMTTAFGPGGVDERALALVAAHLAALARANAGDAGIYGQDVGGRIDFETVALVGHSSGGGAALALLRSEAGVALDADAMVLLAAAYNSPDEEGIFVTGDALLAYYATPSDLPLVTILPDCDGDQTRFWTQAAYEAARLDPERAAWALSLRLMRANHNGFNQTLDSNPDNRFGYGPCFAETADIMPPAEQQDWLVAFLPDALDAALADPASFAPLLAEAGPSWYGQAVQTMQLAPVDRRLTVMVPTEHEPARLNALGAPFATDREWGFSVCRTGEICLAPLTVPGRLGYLRVMVFGRGDVAFALPEALADVRRYDALTVRITPDYLANTNLAGEGQAFSLVLRDAGGNEAEVAFGPETPSLFVPPPEEFYGYASWFVYPATLSAPLAAFEGVDLSAVATVALRFGATREGTFLVADLAFVDE
jgi:dienelactone hydrolase